jgi:hypothetical protein
VWNHVWHHEIFARLLARRVAAWARPFAPQVLWVLPELHAVPVALQLVRRLRVPVHLTIHDAHECASDSVVPECCMPAYMARVRRLVGASCSLDAVTEELCKHAAAYRGGEMCWRAIPPGMDPRLMWSPQEWPGADTIRIAFCGSMRAPARQWAECMAKLAARYHRVEVTVISSDSDAAIPAVSGVSIRRMPYVEDDGELLHMLRRNGTHAGYLGLWKEPARALFALTSLSSKVVTYAAAGIPILYDGPERSAVAGLLGKYNAGLTVDEAAGGVLGERVAWTRIAAGSAAMARQALNADLSAQELTRLLTAAAA